MLCHWRPEEGVKSRTEIIGGYEPLCECYELNLTPLQEQQVLLSDESCRSWELSSGPLEEQLLKHVSSPCPHQYLSRLFGLAVFYPNQL